MIITGSFPQRLKRARGAGFEPARTLCSILRLLRPTRSTCLSDPRKCGGNGSHTPVVGFEPTVTCRPRRSLRPVQYRAMQHWHVLFSLSSNSLTGCERFSLFLIPSFAVHFPVICGAAIISLPGQDGVGPSGPRAHPRPPRPRGRWPRRARDLDGSFFLGHVPFDVPPFADHLAFQLLLGRQV